jgi:hypothetical protein
MHVSVAPVGRRLSSTASAFIMPRGGPPVVMIGSVTCASAEQTDAGSLNDVQHQKRRPPAALAIAQLARVERCFL